MVESAQPDIADKLSELLKAVERSIKASEQNKETLTEVHELGTRKHTDLIKSQQEQQAQLATLISQSTLQQWRSQTFIFGGANRTPKARDHL
jgi:hypothetical protein